MYIVAVVLFLIPGSMLLFAWLRGHRYTHGTTVRNWRDHCLTASLIGASFAVLIGMAANIFWLHLGGNPHGMGTPVGLWVPLRRIFLWTISIGLILAILGKGKGRFIACGALDTAFASDLMIGILDMD
jgi:hypothetical protein